MRPGALQDPATKWWESTVVFAKGLWFRSAAMGSNLNQILYGMKGLETFCNYYFSLSEEYLFGVFCFYFNLFHFYFVFCFTCLIFIFLFSLIWFYLLHLYFVFCLFYLFNLYFIFLFVFSLFLILFFFIFVLFYFFICICLIFVFILFVLFLFHCFILFYWIKPKYFALFGKTNLWKPVFCLKEKKRKTITNLFLTVT